MDTGRTQASIALADQPPSIKNHEVKSASSKDHHAVHDDSKATVHHHKKHGRRSILDQIVLMKLNKKKGGDLCRTTKESGEEEVGVKNETWDAQECSFATKQCGDTKYVGENVVGKMNKRKRGRCIQGSLWNGNSLEQEFKTERTDEFTQREQKCATDDEDSGSHCDGVADTEGWIKTEEMMDAEVDKEIVAESSKAPQGIPSVGGRFQALNAERNIFKTSGKLFGMMSKMEDRKRHTCSECGRSFNQLRVLNMHQQMHTVKRIPFLTNDEQSSREQTLKVRQHSGQEEPGLRGEAQSEKNDFCKEIEKEVAQSRTCLQEMETQSAYEKESGVGEEEEVTQSRNYLQEVSEQHVKGANHVKAITKKRKALDPEIRKVDLDESCSDQKGYPCEVCGKIFSLPSFLRRHEIVHTGEKAFSCKHCGKGFGQKASLQRHEQTHGRNQPYMCNECGDGFSSPKRLERHVKERHRASSKESDLPPIKISLKSPKHEESLATDCVHEEEKTLGKESEAVDTNTEMYMESTVLVQPKEPKVYTCFVCEKTFLLRSHLLRHSLCHTGEKPFKCKECGKGFTQKSTCLRHERTHSGELLFICTECGNSFAQKSGLQKHRRIHTGEKPYGCRFCECRFTQKTTCQRHERIHTGEKPYVCQQCGKAFGQSTSLERHIKTHLKVKQPGDETELK